jgi:hypothetical protein
MMDYLKTLMGLVFSKKEPVVETQTVTEELRKLRVEEAREAWGEETFHLVFSRSFAYGHQYAEVKGLERYKVVSPDSKHLPVSGVYPEKTVIHYLGNFGDQWWALEAMEKIHTAEKYANQRCRVVMGDQSVPVW